MRVAYVGSSGRALGAIKGGVERWSMRGGGSSRGTSGRVRMGGSSGAGGERRTGEPGGVTRCGRGETTSGDTIGVGTLRGGAGAGTTTGSVGGRVTTAGSVGLGGAGAGPKISESCWRARRLSSSRRGVSGVGCSRTRRMSVRLARMRSLGAARGMGMPWGRNWTVSEIRARRDSAE